MQRLKDLLKLTYEGIKDKAAWEKAGMQTGNIYEVTLNVEGYKASGGKAKVNKNALIIGFASDYDNIHAAITSVFNDSNSFKLVTIWIL
mgnify:CR=1 FL=1